MNIEKTRDRYRELIVQTGMMFPQETIGPDFPKSLTEWEAYATELRRGLMAVLNIPEERVELDARIVGKVDLSDLHIEKVIYLAEPGSKITANLYIPDRVKETVPAFILCSGTNASKNTDFNQIMGQYLAHAGCLCLVPDNIGEGDRRIGGYHFEYVDEFVKLNYQLYGKLLFDLMRGVDYLLSRAEVDPQRIGTTGHSLGGGLAANLAALDRRIQLSIPASPGLLCRSRKHPLWKGQGAQASFGMGRLVGSTEIIALVAPRKMLVVIANGDSTADPEIVEKNTEAASRIWAFYEEEKNLAIHRLTDCSGHGPHFLCREAFQFIAKHFGLPRLSSSRINSTPMVKGEIDWYPKTSILDMKRHVFSSLIPPHLPDASHCPQLDCLTAKEVLEPEYGTRGWLEKVRTSKGHSLPQIETWEEWIPVREKVIASLRDLIRLPKLARRSQPLKKGKLIEKSKKRTVNLVTLGLPPVEGYLITHPSKIKKGKAMIYLHESRTKEGALACSECRNFLGQNYQIVLLLDTVASDDGCNNDIYLGFSATAVNVANVRIGLDYLTSLGFEDITVWGEMDDIAILVGITDDRVTSVINGRPAGTEPVSYVPREWGWTYWEGTVPGIDLIADRAVLMACLAPRPLRLRFQHIPDFTSRIYQLWYDGKQKRRKNVKTMV